MYIGSCTVPIPQAGDGSRRRPRLHAPKLPWGVSESNRESH